jgi:hypothetical protein
LRCSGNHCEIRANASRDIGKRGFNHFEKQQLALSWRSRGMEDEVKILNEIFAALKHALIFGIRAARAARNLNHA